MILSLLQLLDPSPLHFTKGWLNCLLIRIQSKNLLGSLHFTSEILLAASCGLPDEERAPLMHITSEYN